MRLKNKRKLYLCFTLVLIALCALAFAVSAAVVAFTLSASSDSITFNAVDGADYYIVRAYSYGSIISADTGVQMRVLDTVSGKSSYTISYSDMASDLKTMLSAGSVTFCVFAYKRSAVKLPSPVLTISGNMASWNAVEHADKYGIQITSVASGEDVVLTTLSGTSYDLSTLAAGTYTVSVSAASTDIDNYLPSDFCTPVRYSKTVKLSEPTNVSINGYVISWSNVENNSGYKVIYRKVGGTGAIYQYYEAAKDVTQHNITLSAGGEYSISVIALGTGNYTDSDESASVSYTPKLSAPVISLSDGRIVWSAVTNATSYSVSFFNPSGNSLYSRDTTSLNYIVDLVRPAMVLSPGNYTIKVTASADGYLTSDYSNVLDCTVKSIAAPVLSVSGNTVSWTAVANTVGYTVYYSKDGGEEVNDILNSDVLSYDFSSLADGTYTVKVVANGSCTQEAPLIYYSMSEYSNTIQFTKTSAASGEGYYITFANIAYDSNYVSNVYIQIDGKGDWITVTNIGELLEYNDVHYFYIYYSTDAPAVHMALLNNDGGYPVMEDASLSQYNITNSVSVATATKVVISEQCDIVVTVFENG